MTLVDGKTADTDEVAADRPTSIMIGGKELVVTYYFIWMDEGTAAVADVNELNTILEQEGYGAFLDHGITSLNVGGVGWRSARPYDLEYWHNQHMRDVNREQVLAGYQARLDSCESRIKSLSYKVQDHLSLHRLLARLKYEMERQGPIYNRRQFDSSRLASSLRELENLLDRVMSYHPVDAVALDLAAERLEFPCVALNRAILDQLKTLQIRSEGLIESLSEDVLFRFYRDRLRGDDGRERITLAEAFEVDLQLELEDYAPADILEELELLSETIEINGKKYSIEYRYLMDNDDEWVAAGIIEVPISLYRRLAPAYGKTSGFPMLPGEVCRFLRVMKAGKFFAAGFDTLDLVKKIDKKEKGQSRIPDAPSVERVTELPPWFMGSAKPGSRR